MAMQMDPNIYKDNFPMSAAERANRSVFVGNIPYEATEEQLKDIFAQVGPVVSFRLVYDRETGKPKGYGFCEYQDIETAKSAMRNLNNHDFNGRPLRVGVAAGETAKDENRGMQQALGGPPVESPFGEAIEPEKAPEAISKAVASLPPEQMFELMKQMKLCIQNNPNEARNMLLQNPQLAYALLQAQIVMKIVDPQVALAMLHRQTEQIPPLMPSENQPQESPHQDVDIRELQKGLMAASAPQNRPPGPNMNQGPGPMGGPNRGPGPGGPQQPMGGPGGPMGGPGGPMGGPGGPMGGPGGPMGGPGGPMGGPGGPMGGPMGGPRMGGPQGPHGPDFGPGNRGGPPRPGGLLGDHPPSQGGGGPRMGNRLEGLPMGDNDMRGPGGPGMRPPAPGPQSRGGGGPQEFGNPGGMDPRGGPRPEPSRDPRQAEPRRPPQGGGGMGGPPQRLPGPGALAGAAAGGGQDQEKAALIMQVLQLTDEQIALLPPDQRQSILILKDQIARSSGPL